MAFGLDKKEEFVDFIVLWLSTCTHFFFNFSSPLSSHTCFHVFFESNSNSCVSESNILETKNKRFDEPNMDAGIFLSSTYALIHTEIREQCAMLLFILVRNDFLLRLFMHCIASMHNNPINSFKRTINVKIASSF